LIGGDGYQRGRNKEEAVMRKQRDIEDLDCFRGDLEAA
jgi:hypothetical protein